MRAINVTSDGTVDISLEGITENPLINGIEIIDNSVATTPGAGGVLLKESVDASATPTSAATTANSVFDWSTVRGAFIVNGTLYYGLPDGGFYARTFNSSTGVVGAQRTVSLNDDPDDATRIPFDIANLTGMFYDTATHRIYYTLFGDSRLFFRGFTPESEVVGAITLVADSNGVDFGLVQGMTLAGGQILYGSAGDGALRSVTFSGGRVTGSPSVTSNDGSWHYRAIVVPSA